MMEEERRENVFTKKDRTVLYDTRKQVREINGSVKRHDEEIFGDKSNHTIGLIEVKEQFLEFRTQIRTGIVIIVTLLGLLGVSNLILLFRSIP